MIKKNIDKQEAIAKIASLSKNARVRETTMTRWMATALLATLAVTGTAHAQTKLQIGCTATTDCASAMVAVDEGIFKKHGLDAEMVPIGINSNIPAAILSGSIQIGGPTSTVFLQAADGGLDLVAVAGATVMSPTSNANITAFVRNGITIKEPKDFIGKKVGAPGLGAFLHVLFVKWLVDKGVDPKKVNFVEVTFPTMPDIIKSGGVDAVLTAEPTVSRMLAAGSGSIGARYASELERTEPIIFYAASREWAEKNPDTVRKFRAAIAEGAAIVNSDKEKTSAAIAKFTKQTIELVKASPPNKSEPVLKPEQLAWWIDVMSSQKMLETKLDLNKLILK
jgi:NitT/TauT family transport system substrate-binding protein